MGVDLPPRDDGCSRTCLRGVCGTLPLAPSPGPGPSPAVLGFVLVLASRLRVLGAGQAGRRPVPSASALRVVSQAVESIQAEDESAKLCKRRIEHLKEHSSDQPAAASMWKRKRMDRMMVEHLLRCGYYNTAVKLARQSGIEVGLGAGRGRGAAGPAPWGRSSG